MADQEASEPEANKDQWQADRRLYLDKDGNVVEHDNINKLSLLVAEGGFLSMEDAEKYGLLKKAAAKKVAEKPAETKKR